MNVEDEAEEGFKAMSRQALTLAKQTHVKSGKKPSAGKREWEDYDDDR